MKIAQQLKERNIAEYLIYMWQVEDLLRANQCNIDLIQQNVISRYPENEREGLIEWYQIPVDYIFLGKEYDLIRTIELKRAKEAI